MFKSWSWDNVISALNENATNSNNEWVNPLQDLVTKIIRSDYSKVFHPSFSYLERTLFLTQTEIYQIGQNVLAIKVVNDCFVFTYFDSGIKEHLWSRQCPYAEGFLTLEKFIAQLHLVIKYEKSAQQ